MDPLQTCETGTPSPAMHLAHLHFRDFTEESTHELVEQQGVYVRTVSCTRFFRRSRSGATTGASNEPTSSSQVQDLPPHHLSRMESWTGLPDEPLPHIDQSDIEEIRSRREANKRWQATVNRQLLTTAAIMFSSTVLCTRNKTTMFRGQTLQAVESAAALLGIFYSDASSNSTLFNAALEGSIWCTYMSLVCGTLTSMLCLWTRHQMNVSISSTIFSEPLHPIRRRVIKLESLSIPFTIKYLSLLPSISTIFLLSSVTLTCATFSLSLALLSAAVVAVYISSTIFSFRETYQKSTLPLSQTAP